MCGYQQLWVKRQNDKNATSADKLCVLKQNQTAEGKGLLSSIEAEPALLKFQKSPPFAAKGQGVVKPKAIVTFAY